jgi:hypothetical protein
MGATDPVSKLEPDTDEEEFIQKVELVKFSPRFYAAVHMAQAIRAARLHEEPMQVAAKAIADADALIAWLGRVGG